MRVNDGKLSIFSLLLQLQYLQLLTAFFIKSAFLASPVITSMPRFFMAFNSRIYIYSANCELRHYTTFYITISRSNKQH